MLKKKILLKEKKFQHRQGLSFFVYVRWVKNLLTQFLIFALYYLLLLFIEIILMFDEYNYIVNV